MPQRLPLAPAGFAGDQPPHFLPADYWSRLVNVHHPRGYGQRVGGLLEVYQSANLLEAPIYLVRAGSYWIYAGGQEVSAVDSAGTHTDLTNTVSMTDVSALLQPWTGGVLNGRLFLNNGSDNPKTWDYNVANDLTDISGWPASTKCKALRAFRDYLIALNMTESSTDYPDKLRWSGVAAAGALPTAWTAAATNDAGDAQLGDTPGAIVDGLQLGQVFMVYKENSAYRLQYVGGNFVFDVRLAFRTLGALARNCIAEFDGRHFVVTNGDVVVHDGVQAESVAAQLVQRYLFDRVASDLFDRVFVAYNKARREMLIFAPTDGNKDYCDVALIWDIQRNRWGLRELPGTNGVAHAAPGIVDEADADTWDGLSAFTWADWTRDRWDQRTFNPSLDSLLLAQPEATAAASSLLAYDTGPDINGTAYSATWERTDLDCGVPDRVKTLRRIWPRVEGTAAGTIEVGARDTPEGTITWSAPVTYTPGSDQAADVSATGRLLAVRFSGFQAVPSFELEYEPRGRF